MPDLHRPRIARFTLLAAASGARTFSGLAGAAQTRAAEPRPRIVHQFDEQIAKVALACAAFELMADKAPNIPDRVSPASLFGRVLAGALIGAALADGPPGGRRSYVIAGGLIAFASAHVTFRARRALARKIPGFAAGLVEDAVVAGVVAAATAL
jgi:uncharacterized membrane protein